MMNSEEKEEKSGIQNFLINISNKTNKLIFIDKKNSNLNVKFY